jgi:tetratricopeptide (TPR) repeat protein
MLIVYCQLAAQDTVVLSKNGRRSNIIGKVTIISNSEVVVSHNETDRQIPANEVLRISFADDPTELRSARNAIIGGQLEQGLDSLVTLKSDSVENKFVRQDIEFYRAYAGALLALRGTGNADDAVRNLVEFARNQRDSYHYFESLKLLGDLAMSLGSFENAIKYYAQFGQAPFADFAMHGTILQAHALRANENYEAAVKMYDKVIQQKENDAEAARQKAFAQIGKSVCLALRGNTGDSVQTIEGILADRDPADTELFSHAYCALGIVYQSANRPMDAALAFLHVDILFFHQRDAHAEALYHLSNLWKQLDKPERAVETRKILTERYGGTVWAKRS